MSEETMDNLRGLVAEVAAAYFTNSHANVAEIGNIIEQIAKSLSAVGGAGSAGSLIEEQAPSVRKLTPAQIRKSISPDALISFEDGKSYKALRRHLTVKGLTPEQYREKWGLPKDYPMVSANYSATRSQMAKDLGLGARGRAPSASRARTRVRRGAAGPTGQ